MIIEKHGAMKDGKREINESVKEYGKSKWREGINQKSSLDWYALKECPKT